MKKKYPHIDLPADVQAFRDRLIAATQWEKTTCGITFYKMCGMHFARAQSSLTGKRVRKSKRFQRTMHNAGILSRAAKIVAPVYNALTEDWRCHDLYRKLTGLAAKLLHAGMDNSEVQEAIQEELFQLGYRTEWPEWELPPNLQQWLGEDTPAADKHTAAQHIAPGIKNRYQYIHNNTHQYSLMVDAEGRLLYYEKSMPAAPS